MEKREIKPVLIGGIEFRYHLSFRIDESSTMDFHGQTKLPPHKVWNLCASKVDGFKPELIERFYYEPLLITSDNGTKESKKD